MQLDAIKALISTDLVEVDNLLEEQLESPVAMIKELGMHLINSGGKRIRPILLILVARAYGEISRKPIVLGAALELIHAATLLHDDVVDNSQMRRGQQTANAIWDNAASVLVGDFLYSRAFQLIVTSQELQILQMLSASTNIIATGEILQLQNRHNPDLTQEDYLNVLRYKTGALFASATQAGAILGLCDDDRVKLMAEFGEALGIAFQLVDDVLDYSADEATLGKRIGDDLADGKLTMPLLHALKNADIEGKNLIRQAIMDGELSALPKLQAIIKTTGSLEYTMDLAKAQIAQAKNCIATMYPSPYKEALVGLTDIVVSREY